MKTQELLEEAAESLLESGEDAPPGFHPCMIAFAGASFKHGKLAPGMDAEEIREEARANSILGGKFLHSRRRYQ